MYRILIVEDDQGIAEAVKKQAQMWELEVMCVQNFRNVMADFAEFEPHLVLLDISLPFLMAIIGAVRFAGYPMYQSYLYPPQPTT